MVIMFASGIEIFVNFGSSHEATGLFVDVYKDNIAFSHLHGALLLTERHKEIFHHSPIQESSMLVHPRHFEISKVAHRGKRLFRSSDQTFRLVEIDKKVERIARTHGLRHIGLRH